MMTDALGPLEAFGGIIIGLCAIWVIFNLAVFALGRRHDRDLHRRMGFEECPPFQWRQPRKDKYLAWVAVVFCVLAFTLLIASVFMGK